MEEEGSTDDGIGKGGDKGEDTEEVERGADVGRLFSSDTEKLMNDRLRLGGNGGGSNSMDLLILEVVALFVLVALLFLIFWRVLELNFFGNGGGRSELLNVLERVLTRMPVGVATDLVGVGEREEEVFSLD